MGVQLLGGKFNKCVYFGTHNRVDIFENITNKIDCLNKNFTWENSRINFDNVFNGCLALFQIVSYFLKIIIEFLFCSNRQRFKVGLE